MEERAEFASQHRQAMGSKLPAKSVRSRQARGFDVEKARIDAIVTALEWKLSKVESTRPLPEGSDSTSGSRKRSTPVVLTIASFVPGIVPLLHSLGIGTDVSQPFSEAIQGRRCC
jgi:hypothetical protein